MSEAAGRPRRIAHLDMDAFYASVELLRRPELKGLPIVIGGRRAAPGMQPEPLSGYVGRGVVTTATYEARAFGIHSAMPMMKARALCPQALALPADFDEYRRCSRLFKAAIAEIAPTIEDRGIDEVYIDLTHLPGDSRAIATAIKANVFATTRLTCSIAVAPNKLLAKIGSELDKPDGLTLITMDDLEALIWPLPARRINGVGPKANERLARLEIHSIGDLARETPEFLIRHFGQNYGRWLHECAFGRDERPVLTHQEPQSRSRETTFEGDTRDWDEIAGVLVTLCEQVALDLKKRGYVGRTIGVKLRYDNFQIVTRDNSLPQAVNDAHSIRKSAFDALGRVAPNRKLARPIRLIGVRVGNLNREGEAPALPPAGQSLDLF